MGNRLILLILFTTYSKTINNPLPDLQLSDDGNVEQDIFPIIFLLHFYKHISILM